jgi:hypothetical protein
MSEPNALTDDCIHHWMLTAPKREVTAAVCKRCGAVRDFLDSEGRSPWNASRVLKPR